MEPVGAISEGEWSSFNGLCYEEADFMAQLLGNWSLPNEVQNGFVWPAHESNVNIDGIDDSTLYSSDETNINMSSFSQGSSIYNEGRRPIFFPSSSHESYYPTVSHQFFVTNNTSMTMDYSLMEGKNNISRLHFLNNNAMEGDDFLNQDVSNDSIESNENMPEDILQGNNLQLGKIIESPMPKPSKGDKISSPSEISKKRPLIPGEDQRNTRSMKLKKCLKVDNQDSDNNNVNTNNAVLLKQSSSNCCSEDESNASHELNGVTSSSISKGSGALSSNGKTRASRGSATDPQSLYARKRRERINERLKILQNLVPNGTKVDISTMLEEAVQYVKFLQLQIKLLSSDDLWMYAPIAYNGMDIGLDLKNIASPKSQS